MNIETSGVSTFSILRNSNFLYTLAKLKKNKREREREWEWEREREKARERKSKKESNTNDDKEANAVSRVMREVSIKDKKKKQ